MPAHPAWRVELQVTQEYTGQQRHVVLPRPAVERGARLPPWGRGGRTTVAAVAASASRAAAWSPSSNVGDDPFWTGHPLAQANLYAFGRLAWDPTLDPAAILDEWIGLTFPPSATADADLLRRTLHAIMDDSWRTYERYTAPLGVGFMVRPGHHYGPDVDGYEYTPWGTYHFADRDGIGVDRTRAPAPGSPASTRRRGRRCTSRSRRCPDELLLFFHHVPYDARAAQRVDRDPAHLRHPLRGRRAVAEMRRRVGAASTGWSTRACTRG